MQVSLLYLIIFNIIFILFLFYYYFCVFSNRSVLYIASLAGYTQIVALLLENGADPNQKDVHGWTPLHRAALWGHVEIARLLIENGANVNASDEVFYFLFLFSIFNFHFSLKTFCFFLIFLF